METFSSDDILQKYLVSQSKLSTMVQKPKIKSYSTIKEQNKIVQNKKLIEKSTGTSKNESGSEYFPSTDSGNRK